MGRKKKISFKLNPEWMLKEPVDFEFNKYTLLDFLQKCEIGFNNLEIYPDFVELSLHLANLQSLSKERTLLLTEKKFESCDDEILVKELVPKKARELSASEEEELSKTLIYSGPKLFDSFNVAKSIWNMAYDSLEISLKKNKENINSGKGYIFFYRKAEDLIYVWEFEIRKNKKDKLNNKTYIKQIYKGPPSELTLTYIIETYSNWKESERFLEYPIFEARCSHNLPLEQTLIPILKRKVTAYVYQIVNLEKISSFDS
jgi:hypothetical protein